jgi:hypothetical protein
LGDGKKIQGLLTTRRLTLKPDDVGSVNVWEISRWVASLTVKKVMIPRGESGNDQAAPDH